MWKPPTPSAQRETGWSQARGIVWKCLAKRRTGERFQPRSGSKFVSGAEGEANLGTFQTIPRA
jgi:hypothetical protein